MTPSILICRTCGGRQPSTLAVNEQELAAVGMLERSCAKCGTNAKWGLAEDYRKRERRTGERRRADRRRGAQAAPPARERRRARERRMGPIRKVERRSSY